MDKLILGYEKFSDRGLPVYNFNGRYLPNSTIYPDDVMELYGQPMKIWFKELITPEKMCSDQIPANYLFSFVHSNQIHEYKIVSEIETGVRYFYPIHVLSMFLYANYVSEISISPKVRNDVMMGNAFIVFVYTSEGDVINFIEKFRNLVLNLNLPKKQILFLHGDLDTAKYDNEPYTYVPVHEMHWWLYHIDGSSLVSDQSKIEKLYICYNRTLRPHKLLFLSQLVNNGLINSGIVSAGKFGIGTMEQILFANNIQMSEENKKIFLSLSNISPDNKTFPYDNPAQETREDHYHKTFLTITTETLEIPLFFSEKTYKPILHRHPFMLVGTQGMLKKLKSFGFQTFNKWWDESYDDEPTMQGRVIKIIEVLSKLNSMSITELKAMRNEMNEILEHNYQNLQKMFDNKDYHAYSEILKILVNLKDSRIK